MDAFIYYKQKCKVVSLNLAHPVDQFLSRQNLEKFPARDEYPPKNSVQTSVIYNEIQKVLSFWKFAIYSYSFPMMHIPQSRVMSCCQMCFVQ